MNRGPFRVTPFGSVRGVVISLRKHAEARGISERVSRALDEIEGHLELHPETWGDPIRIYKGLHLSMYRRLHDKLRVEYGVHETEPLVFITGLTPALDHPLAGLI